MGVHKSSFSVKSYADQFRVPCSVDQTFDASPQTVFIGMPGQNFIERACLRRSNVSFVRKVLGADIKFILTVKDPVRWVSSVTTSKSFNPSSMDRLIKLTCLADALEEWLRLFSRKQFLFLDAYSMFNDLNATMVQVFQHIGVRPFPVLNNFSE